LQVNEPFQDLMATLVGGTTEGSGNHHHQQPEVNYLPRFSPQLISLERYTLGVYRAGEIDLFDNLDIVYIRLLVAVTRS